MDQKLDVLNEMIRIPQQSTVSIDMNYFAPYNPDLGFRFEVEAIYNNQTPTALFMVLASLCPQASLYDAARTEAALDVRLLMIYKVSASRLMRWTGRVMCTHRDL